MPVLPEKRHAPDGSSPGEGRAQVISAQSASSRRERKRAGRDCGPGARLVRIRASSCRRRPAAVGSSPARPMQLTGASARVPWNQRRVPENHRRFPVVL